MMSGIREIRDFEVWRRAINRFHAYYDPSSLIMTGSNPGLSNIIIPTTDLNHFMIEPKMATVTKNIGSAGQTYHTVPEGKRWKLSGIHKEATVGSVRVYINNNEGDGFIIIPSTTSEKFQQCDIMLGAGWDIILSVGNGADTSIDCSIVYQEEEVDVPEE